MKGSRRFSLSSIATSLRTSVFSCFCFLHRPMWRITDCQARNPQKPAAQQPGPGPAALAQLARWSTGGLEGPQRRKAGRLPASHRQACAPAARARPGPGQGQSSCIWAQPPTQQAARQHHAHVHKGNWQIYVTNTALIWHPQCQHAMCNAHQAQRAMHQEQHCGVYYGALEQWAFAPLST